MNNETLPEWLSSKLRNPLPATAINGENDKYSVIFPDGSQAPQDKEFNEFSEAYAYALEHTGENIVLQGDAQKFHGTLKSDDEGSYEVYESYTDQDRYNKIVNDFNDFQDIALKYHAVPSDFMRSYNFVMRHPAFWVAEPLAHEEDGRTLNWSTNYQDRIVVYPIQDGADDIMWLVNAESHLLDNVFGDDSQEDLSHQSVTIEEAYIKVAEKLATVYNDNGELSATYQSYAENLSSEENLELNNEVEDILQD